MAEYSSARRRSHAETSNSLSVGYVAVASILCGVGLFTIFTWLITFDWAWFLGVLPLALGVLMFFQRRSGSDRAE